MTKNQSQKRKPNYGANKSSFDSVMATYREMKDRGVGAAGLGDGSATSPNPAKPSPTEFRCDVDMVLNDLVASHQRFRFNLVYVVLDVDQLDREILADKLIGKRRHSIEQRVGAEFLNRKIASPSTYFHSIRQPRGRV
jgi:hypothetical protein